MIIFVDGIHLEGQRTGMGKYLESLLKIWAEKNPEHQFKVGYISEKPADPLFQASNMELIQLTFENPDQTDIFEAAINNSKADRFFSPYYALPHSLNIDGIITVHDMVYKAFPETLTPIQRAWFEAEHNYSLPKAKRIVTDSIFSKKEILHYFPDTEEKIEVIPLAAQLPEFGECSIAELGITTPFLLYVGTITIKRPIKPLFEAFKQLSDKITLVIVGKNNDPENSNLEEEIRDFNLSSNEKKVVMVPFVSNDMLHTLYSKCALFIYPSIYEGFGLPILEAFLHGAAVLTTKAASIPEVAGNSAYFVTSLAPAELKHGIEKLLEDPELRASLIEGGKKRAAQFSWEETAERTLAQFLL